MATDKEKIAILETKSARYDEDIHDIKRMTNEIFKLLKENLEKYNNTDKELAVLKANHVNNQKKIGDIQSEVEQLTQKTESMKNHTIKVEQKIDGSLNRQKGWAAALGFIGGGTALAIMKTLKFIG